ncbi:hypothetical protein [Halanaerobacter jeridensis]|uniref:Uncharacterized protein n=1 Tax=Halanaerobacter jeridensis TaxID=706427 RepID=A0A938XRJ5_9FIRM|nr:hypothetical protein [Halanaerobacter jeridensis]MBM7556098.1 hypothetical protein [Halanaerobacter jeridensis]
MIKKVYCYKCGSYYWTPKGEKEIKDCPFCSLGKASDNNLSYKEKLQTKRINYNNYDK